MNPQDKPTVEAVAAALSNYMPSMGRQVWEAAARAAIDAIERTGQRQWRITTARGHEVTTCTEAVALRYVGRVPNAYAEYRPVGAWERVR